MAEDLGHSVVDKGTPTASVSAEAQPPRVEPGRQPSTLELFGAGLVLSCTGRTFYRYVARRQVMAAVGFFLAFSVVLSVIASAKVGVDMAPSRAQIDEAFRSGTVPAVTLRQGVATIHGRQPFVLVNENGTLIVLDTTGRYTAADVNSGRYETALLLTRTEFLSFNNGKLTTVKLKDLQSFLGDPFELNSVLVQQWLNMFQTVVFVAIFVWNVLIRLLYVTLLALVVWGVTALARRDPGFGPVFVTGLCATVPLSYGQYLLERLSIRFCGLGTLMLLAVWTIALTGVVAKSDLHPIYTEHALIGLPVLAALVLDAVTPWPNGALIVVAFWVVTIGAIRFIDWQRKKTVTASSPAT